MLEWPVDKQAAAAKESVSVVTGIKHGRHWTTNKPAAKLTRTEAERVLGPGGIRSPEEQAKLLATPKMKEESLGRFTVFLMNRKPFIKHSTTKGECTKIVVIDPKAIEIELVRESA